MVGKTWNAERVHGESKPAEQGWKMALKPRFLTKTCKKAQKSKTSFLLQLYADHIKFQILVVICDFWYILQKTL